jgi:prevent-host-death family protein
MGDMSTVTIVEAQAQLPELIDRVHSGDEVVITRDQQPVARLIADLPADNKARRCGTMKGTVLYMAPDFDAPLEDFKDYM